MIWLCSIIVLGYALVILILSKEMLTYAKTEITSSARLLPFTIIINYRNEEKNLPALLHSIKKQDYDFNLLQWIFINDSSTDQGFELLKSFSAANAEIEFLFIDRKIEYASGKKDGITQAVQLSKHDRIITTDADCVLPIPWILSYNEIYNKQKDAHFIAAPVQLTQEESILSTLQQQEMMALQLITAGSFSFRQPFMCNGANMSFNKKAFQEVNGYEGNCHISSGDDIFLLEKLAAEDVMKCHYLKSKTAIVSTYPKTNLKEVISQRARWAQKGSETKSLLNKLVSLQVLLMSVLFIANPFLWYFSIITSKMFIGIMLTKFFTDFIVLAIGDQFFENVRWKYALLNFFIYPFVVIAISVKSLSKPQWSNRKINT